MNDFLSFNKMLTPVIIQIVFWIGVGFSALIGLMIVISGLSYYGNGFQVLFGLITIVVGPLVVRIYCELLIIAFKMHESLQQIKNKLNETTVNVNEQPIDEN